MPFLLKTEPNKYSYDDLLRDRQTLWDGIANNQALLYLRNMKKGEQLVIYHSNIGKAAIGTAKVVSVDASDPKHPKVLIKPVKRLKQEKPLDEIRNAPSSQTPSSSASSASPSSPSPTPNMTSSPPDPSRRQRTLSALRLLPSPFSF